MTDYDFRQHIGEWVETRGGDRIKVIGYNPEVSEHEQLIVQYPEGGTCARSVSGAYSSIGTMMDLVLPVREHTTLVKLWRWNGGVNVTAIPEDHWRFYENREDGKWLSEPTEVTFKLLPGVKLP